MAASKDWSELNEEELYQLITQPMSAADLAEYQEVMAADDFDLMVGRYHANAALSSMRAVVLGYFKHGVSLEMMITALANVWLDNFAGLTPDLDAETVQSWRRMPQLLIQILLQQALDALNSQREEVVTEYPPEYQEMYAEWHAAMPARQAAVSDPSLIDTALLGEQALALYQMMAEFDHELRKGGLWLEPRDYLELWTQVLLQTYTFGQDGQQEIYFLIQSNWGLFMPRLGEVVTMMMLLKGFESLLLPENRSELEKLIYSPEFEASLDG